MGAMQRVARVLSPFCVIQLFSHEVADHWPHIRFRRKSHQRKSSKGGKDFHVLHSANV